MKPNWIVWLSALLILAAVNYARGDSYIDYEFFGITRLGDLSSGEQGEGTLLFFDSVRGLERPKLVVRLNKNPTAETATAEVFEAPAGMDFVPVVFGKETVEFSQSLTPAITLKAQDGWWVRDGKTNYNLDIQINTPSYSMWGASYDSIAGFGGWAAEIEQGEQAVSIQVRDPERDGIPKWDWRHLIPEFPGRGYLRTNYVERKCDTPLRHEAAVSPEWPFVAFEGGFEQHNGVLQPPIVVDWERGKITHFSELVTARNQNCSYTIYSISPVEPGALNEANFETPFAFYDLSGEGDGYPNLILRTERFPAGDRWSSAIDSKVQQGVPVRQDFEIVRYSWSNHVGNLTWDYKVEVLGGHPYMFNTEIADGLAFITAPPFGVFPKWVIEHDWPVITFVDTEDTLQRSSEGIYEWSPREVGGAYFLGNAAGVAAEAFSFIHEGLRGEYSFKEARQPELYLSPIDNRLHLLYAQGGLFHLGGGWALRLENLGGGAYLDSWALEPLYAILDVEDIRFGHVESEDSKPLEHTRPGRLIKAGSFVAYVDDGGMVLTKVDTPDALFITQPPTDREEWRVFREQVLPFDNLRRDPSDLKDWLYAFEGPTLELRGASIRAIEPSADGEALQFVLNVHEGVSLSGDLFLPAFDGLAPGDYVLTYSRAEDSWRRVAATPPRVVAFIEATDLGAFQPGELALTLVNSGTVPWRGDVGLRIGKTDVHTWYQTVIAGETSLVKSLTWSPDSFGELPVALLLDGQEYRLDTAAIVSRPRIQGVGSFALSLDEGKSVPAVAALLGLCLLLGCASLWLMWRRV